MRSSRLAALALASILSLALTACPQTQDKTGPAAKGPSGAPPAEGAPPEMNTAAHPDDARWKLAEGEGVALSGTVSYEGEAPEGAVRVDVLTQAGDAPPHLVSAETLEGLGAFTIRAPKDFGEVHLVAFIDRAGDGPSPDDAAATVKVSIGAEDVPDLSLALSDEPDLGGLTPGAPPTENGAPPEGDAAGGPAPGEGGPPPEGDAAGGPPPEAGAPPVEGAAGAPPEKAEAPEAPPAE